ncbi:hypothetical protein N7456_009878 [Penicillium angulare]|uniref:Uncharacterized protein n=1 Tax=Penicillium angulare TaxID=116970 RepID=A0A9W9F5N6_9EURO|nr:hypothetical protein N7456_009878 [Penicillium angulare]
MTSIGAVAKKLTSKVPDILKKKTKSQKRDKIDKKERKGLEKVKNNNQESHDKVKQKKLDEIYKIEKEESKKIDKPHNKQRVDVKRRDLESGVILPADWTDAERDVGPQDLDAQIARCKKRIRDNYWNSLFVDRLRVLQGLKRAREGLRAMFPGVSDDVADRLKFLADLDVQLSQDGDKHQVQYTVQAIMTAYQTYNLGWIPGYVTYWSGGQQLSEPRAFDWHEFLMWNHYYHGWRDFWVEGVPIALRCILPPPDYTLPPSRRNVDLTRPQREYPLYHSHVPRVAVAAKLPHAGEEKISRDIPVTPGPKRTSVPLDTRTPYKHMFIWLNDDTGSDICTITERDKDDLVAQTSSRRPNAPHRCLGPPLLGYIRVASASGESHFEPVVALEINCRSEDGDLMLKKWDVIEVAIAPDNNDFC